MTICDYGCGGEAKFIMKNGKNCCSVHCQTCPELRRKNKGRSKNHTFRVNANTIKKECIYCGRQCGLPTIKYHQTKCYLNPDNLKLCPVCDKPIFHYQCNKTCSFGCANTLFRTGINAGQWKNDSYRSTCFWYHGKKCIICEESNMVHAHHYDENRSNNDPSNLIPLCPTHHLYIHSRFKELIIPQVEAYVREWSLKDEKTDNEA